MRVPPDQSSTLAEHCGQRLVRVLRFRARASRWSAACRTGTSARACAHPSPHEGNAGTAACTGSSSRRYRAARRSAAAWSSCPRYFRSISAPPAFMLARKVRRMSMMWPRRCGARRRVFTSSSASTSRLIASLACAISAALICAKSFFCSTSRSDTVRRASSSISRSSGGFLSFMPENSASCTRLRAGLRRLRRGGRRLRRQHRQQLVEIGALPEEHPERLIEQHRMLVALHEHGVQRPVEILARADARRLHRFERIEHAPGPTGMPARAQRAREIDDVLREAAASARRHAPPLAGEVRARR